MLGDIGGRSCPASPPLTRERASAGVAPRGTRRWGLHGGTHTDAEWSSLGTLSDVPSSLNAGYYHIHPTLV
ncbi:hypothetical protein CesoFtcFv8_017069 [Champsocephalus esox]|uniref:Uncharacterized protein n=1 Tax=Champsocephalus esox TaxID=159716 RepID=A0AAN8BJJ9_9TELE|nr:hypothetical protein CesoFtcFv8_017069 [Champsocephalus esox]